MKPLKLFTDPWIIWRLPRALLAEFFARFTHFLPHKYFLPDPSPSNDAYPDCLAQLMEQPEQLPAPLVQALLDVEALATSESISQPQPATDTAPEYITLSRFETALRTWLTTSASIETQNSKTQNGSSDEPSTCNLQPATVPAPHESINPLIHQSSPAAPHSNGSPPHQSINPPIHESSPITPGLPIKNQKSKIENGNGSEPLTKSEFEQILARLAKLSEVDYELVRRDEAKRLHLRVRALDDAVEAVRLRENDAEAEKIGLSLIEPWPEPITDPPALFDEVHDRALLYFYLPTGAAVVLTLWPAHAHVIRAFTQTPRLNLTSIDPGCGKSTVLNFVATLCPKVFSTDNLKPAVLFRVVARHHPTTVLDELDTYLHLYPELRGLLNAGHDPDACVHRVENHNIRAFNSFAAAALAGLGHLSPALRSRSIIIPLSEAPPGSLKLRFDKRKLDVENILARKIARWAQDNFDAIASCDPPTPAYNRLADNWRPLFAVAHVIGGHWPQRILDAFNSLTQHRHPSTKPQGDLLADIRNAFAKAGVNRMSCKELAQALVALGHHPAGNSYPGDPRWLSRRLSALGIHSRNLRFGERQAKGYELSDFISSHEPSPTSSFT